MGKASRDRGKRGELQWRDQLRAAGYHAERGAQRSGSRDSPDVRSNDEVGERTHAEVKLVEKLQVHAALEQARQDAGGKMPYVAHRRNNDQWKVTMFAADFLELLVHRWPPSGDHHAPGTLAEAFTRAEEERDGTQA